MLKKSSEVTSAQPLVNYVKSCTAAILILYHTSVFYNYT